MLIVFRVIEGLPVNKNSLCLSFSLSGAFDDQIIIVFKSLGHQTSNFSTLIRLYKVDNDDSPSKADFSCSQIGND